MNTICICPAVKDFDKTTTDDLKLADKELYLMISVIYQGKKYALAMRHDNSGESMAEFDDFCDMAAFTVKHTAKKKGWVTEDEQSTEVVAVGGQRDGLS